MADSKTLIGLIGYCVYVESNFNEDDYEYWIPLKFELKDYVLDLMGFPKDNTVKLGFFHKDSFCRDYLWDIFGIQKPLDIYDNLIKELNNLNQKTSD